MCKVKGPLLPNKEKFSELVKRYKRSPEFLFTEFADPNQPGMTGDTLLHAAVVRNSIDDVDLLIASGVRVNVTGDLGNTPLHYAASRGFTNIAKRLLQHGANPSSKNEFNQTPYDLAVLMKHTNLAVILEVRKSKK